MDDVRKRLALWYYFEAGQLLEKNSKAFAETAQMQRAYAKIIEISWRENKPIPNIIL